MKIWNSLSLWAGVLLTISIVSPLKAQERPVAENCFEVVTAMNFALQGMPDTGVMGISLKNGGETRLMIFVALGNAADQSNPAKWRILERQNETLTYCLIGAGDELEILQSLHDIPGFGAEFGLPGTSRRRCNDESDGAMGSVAVRAWANKELGPSLVQHFGSPFRGSSYTALIANDRVQGGYAWTLLKSDGNRNCYLSQGDDSSFSPDFAMRPELVQDPNTLPPLQ